MVSKLTFGMICSFVLGSIFLVRPMKILQSYSYFQNIAKRPEKEKGILVRDTYCRGQDGRHRK